jgi:hypothetical protein
VVHADRVEIVKAVTDDIPTARLANGPAHLSARLAVTVDQRRIRNPDWSRVGFGRRIDFHCHPRPGIVVLYACGHTLRQSS